MDIISRRENFRVVEAKHGRMPLEFFVKFESSTTYFEIRSSVYRDFLKIVLDEKIDLFVKMIDFT